MLQIMGEAYGVCTEESKVWENRMPYYSYQTLHGDSSAPCPVRVIKREHRSRSHENNCLSYKF